jgi:hypothetical protein
LQILLRRQALIVECFRAFIKLDDSLPLIRENM